jgi:hypothetical protein
VPRPASTVRRLEAATGALASAAVARMADTLPWFGALPPQERSWIGLVARAGIDAFVQWYRHPDTGHEVSADVFGPAPRALTRAITLQQTVEMVRVTIDVVEEYADQLAAPGHVEELREAVLHYAREVAFATAQVYAEAAETRGAWDARLEALVVEALLRGDAGDDVIGRAAALGWGSPALVWAVASRLTSEDPQEAAGELRRAAQHSGLVVMTGNRGNELIALLGGSADPMAATRELASRFPPGSLVVGPGVTDLGQAPASLRPAVTGLAVVTAWPQAPRPVAADDLLPERAMAGDASARDQLVRQVFEPLAAAGGGLLDTAATLLERSGSLEGAARALFVHANTVRYRIRRIAEVSGQPITQPRGAFTLHLALGYGRLADAETPL